MPQPITILIVDDHEVVRQGLRAYLSAQPDLEVVAEAGSGEEAVRLAVEFVPDVALMDLLMPGQPGSPGMDGIEATRLLKKASPRTQVVVLTSYHEDEHIFPALRAGAISYLLKDVKMEEMAAQMVVSENTVKGHVSNILGKLHLADRTQAAIFA